MTYPQIIFLAYVGTIVLFSLMSFGLFLSDKKKAEKGTMRTKEKTLLLSAVFNGALGAFLGIVIARHKTNKAYFSIVIISALLVQAAVLVALGYMAFVR